MEIGYLRCIDGDLIPLRFSGQDELEKFRETLIDVMNDDYWLRSHGFDGKRYEPDSAEIGRVLYSEIYGEEELS
ncbi:hypothetical protein HYT56_04340 [Candidatus Woesearchaeota archaeon]|nr:hypothetical protein [Candidatus Woesearchaeota archaeon]